jgi:hypothetical protein
VVAYAKISSSLRSSSSVLLCCPEVEFAPIPSLRLPAAIFTHSSCDHLLPHVEKVKVAHPLVLRAITAVKRTSIGAFAC